MSFDTNITIGLRRSMIEDIEGYFIENKYSRYKPVIDAMADIPRHIFVPRGLESIAYRLNSVKIEEGQTMSNPITVALQTFLLDINKDMKVLEIGTGSGYQAAVLSKMLNKLTTLERHKELNQGSINILNILNIKNVKALCQDGFLVYKPNAPPELPGLTAASV